MSKYAVNELLKICSNKLFGLNNVLRFSVLKVASAVAWEPLEFLDHPRTLYQATCEILISLFEYSKFMSYRSGAVEMWLYLEPIYCRFTAEFASKRISKTSQYLKLRCLVVYFIWIFPGGGNYSQLTRSYPGVSTIFQTTLISTKIRYWCF